VPTVAYVALVWAIGAQGLVVVDEANASLRGLALVASDERVPQESHAVAARALLGAFTVYASAWLAELVVLGAWPTVQRLVLGAPHVALPAPPPAAVWVGLAFAPLLVLRAMSVLVQVGSPEPVTTDFQLLSRLQRERVWELVTAGERGRDGRDAGRLDDRARVFDGARARGEHGGRPRGRRPAERAHASARVPAPRLARPERAGGPPSSRRLPRTRPRRR
jgi:hypothetical protein